MRPDASISVYSKDISKDYQLEWGTLKENIRYCNDNEDCANKALEITFTPKKYPSPTIEKDLDALRFMQKLAKSTWSNMKKQYKEYRKEKN